MSYDDMPAGPELDRLIAEKVMGWKVSPNPRKYHAKSVNQWGQPVLCVVNVGHGYDAYEEEIFCPSNNIAHAWEVAEWMAELGWLWASCGIDNGPETARTKPGLRYWCRIQPHAEAWADTAALAICRAALKATTTTPIETPGRGE